jgi:hypothetical protein
MTKCIWHEVRSSTAQHKIHLTNGLAPLTNGHELYS